MGMVIPLRPGRAMSPPAPRPAHPSARQPPASRSPAASAPPEPPLADRVAAFCRGRLLEPGTVAVSLDSIAWHLDLERDAVQDAVDRLAGQRRITLRPFSLRSRPHVVIQAVCGIDDVTAPDSGRQDT